MKLNGFTRMSLADGCLLCTALLVLLAGAAMAAPPHPSVLEKASLEKSNLPYYLENLAELRKNGIGKPSVNLLTKGTTEGAAMAPSATGTFKALAILVQFSDQASSVQAGYFDSLLFDSVGNTVRDYYDEISYGQLDIVTVNLPTALGWQLAPQTYAFYVNNQNGVGSYPQNSQKLLEDLVDQIDAQVDFSQYDNDGDGYVDVVTMIHSGSGAEYSGLNSDIWSHKWEIFPRLKDGVLVKDYTIQPEYWTTPGDMTIGVYAHELGHAFGLPDLYDTDYSSNGIGRWGLMAFGSWLGPGLDGSSPAHPSAWCRIQMGFATSVNVVTNRSGEVINPVENGGSIYRLWNSGAASNEYFLIENRQKTGYDSYLPGHGLLIWHIDRAKSDNTEEWYT
ncbi:MAG: M6 family metalloprotease domain-containing protein, partial [bacterium]|nr:M6 family metalloprotease domain-containing protein [bacterium]